jgi:Domain of unknown function (DUF4383)
LLGLFPINLLHNLVHLGVGIWGLAAYPNISRARGFARGLAVLVAYLMVADKSLGPLASRLRGVNQPVI